MRGSSANILYSKQKRRENSVTNSKGKEKSESIRRVNEKGIIEYTHALTGKLHRKDGPAVIEPDGRHYWYLHGELHREGAPACYNTRPYLQRLHADYDEKYEEEELNTPIEERMQGLTKTKSGEEDWFRNEKWFNHEVLHREDGPAWVDYGEKRWYKDGVVHRSSGPAIVTEDGREAWYKEGNPL